MRIYTCWWILKRTSYPRHFYWPSIYLLPARPSPSSPSLLHPDKRSPSPFHSPHPSILLVPTYRILQVKHIEKEDALPGHTTAKSNPPRFLLFVVTQPKAIDDGEKERNEREGEREREELPSRALMLHSRLRRSFLLSIFIVLALRSRR